MNRGEATLRKAGEELVLLAAFLLSSGHGLLSEPVSYGPMRCLDAARRVLALAAELGITDEGLDALRGELENFMAGPMGKGEVGVGLDGMCSRLAALVVEGKAISRD